MKRTTTVAQAAGADEGVWRTTLAWGAPALLALAALPGCSHQGEVKAKVETTVKPVAVTVAPLEHRPVERTVEMVGTLRGWEQVTVGSKRTGRVLKILNDMGDRVKPGETLVELDPVDAVLAVSQADSKLLAELVKLGITREDAQGFVDKYGITEKLLQGEEIDRLIEEVPSVKQMKIAERKALQNLTRQRALTQRGAGTLQELDNFENDHKAAEAAYENAVLSARTVIANAVGGWVALNQAKQQLDDMTVRAPVPSAPVPSVVAQVVGQTKPLTYAVTKRVVSEGQMVREGEPIADLVIESPLRLWGNVPERYSNDVSVGQTVRLSVASRPGETFEGKVARINPSVDEVSRTFQVEVAVPNDDGVLRPGGFAKASVVTRRSSDATVVPLESVVRFAGVVKLFVVEGDKARAVEVKTGLEGDGWVEVNGQLPTQANVVTTGQTQLADGTPVLVRAPGSDTGKSEGDTEEAEGESPGGKAPAAKAAEAKSPGPVASAVRGEGR